MQSPRSREAFAKHDHARLGPRWYGIRYDPVGRITACDEPIWSFVGIFVQNDAIGQFDCLRQSFDTAREPPADINLRHVMPAESCSQAYASQALIDIVQAYENQRHVISRPSSIAERFHWETSREGRLENEIFSLSERSADAGDDLSARRNRLVMVRRNTIPVRIEQQEIRCECGT
jgi:hypothetical protein